MRNVSRAWAFETGLAAGVELGPGRFLLEHSKFVLIRISMFVKKFLSTSISNILDQTTNLTSSHLTSTT